MENYLSDNDTTTVSPIKDTILLVPEVAAKEGVPASIVESPTQTHVLVPAEALQQEGEASFTMTARPWVVYPPKIHPHADYKLPTIDLFTAKQLRNILLRT